jgi:hypothetical protein
MGLHPARGAVRPPGHLDAERRGPARRRVADGGDREHGRQTVFVPAAPDGDDARQRRYDGGRVAAQRERARLRRLRKRGERDQTE